MASHVLELRGGRGRNRTADTGIFNSLPISRYAVEL